MAARPSGGRPTYDQPNPSNIPIPDPTVITAQEIAKARDELRSEFRLSISGLRDTLVAAREGYIATFNARLDAMDKAAVVLEANLNRVPTLLDRETSRLEKVLEEKISNIHIHFENVSTRFNERDIRFNQDKAAVAAAIDAALQAQKEAVQVQNLNIATTFAKSEMSFTKEVDGLKTLINATKDAVAADIANLTGRMDRGEGGQQGARTQVEDHRANTALMTAVIGGIVGFVALVVTIFGLWLAAHPSGSQRAESAGAAIAVAPLNPSAIAPSPSR